MESDCLSQCLLFNAGLCSNDSDSFLVADGRARGETKRDESRKWRAFLKVPLRNRLFRKARGQTTAVAQVQERSSKRRLLLEFVAFTT